LIINEPIRECNLILLNGGQLDVNSTIRGVWPLDQWHEAIEKLNKGEAVKSV
jgi:L-iditol 2-dehydrogenase